MRLYSSRGKEICPSCRAVYEVIIKQVRLPLEDYFDCVVCGHRLWAWKSTYFPEIYFVKRGQKPANDGASDASSRLQPPGS